MLPSTCQNAAKNSTPKDYTQLSYHTDNRKSHTIEYKLGENLTKTFKNRPFPDLYGRIPSPQGSEKGLKSDELKLR